MTPNIPTLLMVADFEDKHSDLLAAARIGKPYEPKTGCAPSPALYKILMTNHKVYAFTPGGLLEIGVC